MQIWRILIILSIALTASFAVAAPIKLFRNIKPLCIDLFDPSRTDESIDKQWKDLEANVILASEFPTAKNYRREINTLKEGRQLVTTYTKYLSRLRYLETRIDALLRSANFMNFLKAAQPSLLLNKEFIEYLKTEHSKTLEVISSEVSRSTELKHGDWSVADFQIAQVSIATTLKSKSFGLEVIALERVVSEYAAGLNARNQWDAAIPLDLYRVSQLKNDMSLFLPREIFIKDASYEVIKVLGSGDRHQIFLVRDMTSGKEQVVKVGYSYSRRDGTLEQQRQLLHDAGLPVVSIKHVESGFHIVERIEIFGSDVVHGFLKNGSHPDMKDLVDFYKFILEKSPYQIQDLKFSNVGRRADGTWVISGWVLAREHNPSLARAEIGISIQTSIIEAYKDIHSERNSMTRLHLTQLIRRFDHEGLLSRGQVENINASLAR